MLYREFTKDKLKVSALGFGCMRFPLLDGEDSSTIDEKETLRMLKYAYDKGINYYDTAYTYHGEKGEEVLGRFLKTIDRDSIYLATKLPVKMCNKFEDYKEKLDKQLERLDTDYIDFYLTHAVNESRFDVMKELDVFSFLDDEKEKGRIKYAGFSFHDDLDVFKDIVDHYDWDFCQIQLNYMDENYQAGVEGLEYAKSKGIDVVIMEPVKGGRLAAGPEEVHEMFAKEDEEFSMAQWALRWIYDLEDISLALSGMSDMNQVKENIDLASRMGPNNLSPSERETIDKVQSFLRDRIKIQCTECEYCIPCPEGVKIPYIFRNYNDASMFDNKEMESESYNNYIENQEDASQCIRCGKCEIQCPQNLDIMDTLEEADRYFRG